MEEERAAERIVLRSRRNNVLEEHFFGCTALHRHVASAQVISAASALDQDQGVGQP